MILISKSKISVTVTIDGLAAHTRKKGELPILTVSTELGNQPSFEMWLAPQKEDRRKLRGFVDERRANRRILAELSEVPMLQKFLEVPERLRSIQLPLGADLSQPIAAAFECAWNEVPWRLREVGWWLEFGLTFEARQELSPAYAEVKRQLRYSPVELPDESRPHEPLSVGNLGRTILEVFEDEKVEVERILAELLNEPEIILSVERDDDPAGERVSDHVDAWNAHYGRMWGPFEA